MRPFFWTLKLPLILWVRSLMISISLKTIDILIISSTIKSEVELNFLVI